MRPYREFNVPWKCLLNHDTVEHQKNMQLFLQPIFKFGIMFLIVLLVMINDFERLFLLQNMLISFYFDGLIYRGTSRGGN